MEGDGISSPNLRRMPSGIPVSAEIRAAICADNRSYRIIAKAHSISVEAVYKIRRRAGAKGKLGKLTKEQKADILNDPRSPKELAKVYNVNPTTIYRIRPGIIRPPKSRAAKPTPPPARHQLTPQSLQVLTMAALRESAQKVSELSVRIRVLNVQMDEFLGP